MANYKVESKITSPSLNNVELKGQVAKLMERFFNERIFSENAQAIIYREAEDAFKNKLDDETIVGIWQGEFWGKWIISAVEVCKYTNDPQLKAFIKKAADQMISYQREDGYIGTYQNSLNVFSPAPEEARKVVGWDCDWNWNLWCRKYTLWGLLKCYELLNDANIFSAAERHASQLIDELETNHINIIKTGTFLGMPSCSILKPMLLLYRMTANEKYLNFSLDISRKWMQPEGDRPLLITNALSGKALTAWYPNSNQWAKAYEMMSCFEGICELYRITGDQIFLNACEQFYEILDQNERNLISSVAYNDVFGDAAREINVITEPCDVIHWMRLCSELFVLTGKPKYMDTFEKAFFNAFMAGVFKDGKWGARGVRTCGRHLWVKEQAKFVHNHCCVNNMPRGFMNLAECAVMSSEDAIYINLANECNVHLQNRRTAAQVRISDGYFTEGKVSINIDFEALQACPVKVRIPAWSQQPAIHAKNGNVTILNDYWVIEPTENAMTLYIDFHPIAVVNKFPCTVPTHDAQDWKRIRWINNSTPGAADEDCFLEENRFYITYGPLVLARSKFMGNTQEEMFTDKLNIDCECQCDLSVQKHDDTLAAFEARLTNDGRTLTTTVCDFASAANMETPDSHYFTIYF